MTFITEMEKLKDNTDLARDTQCQNIKFHHQNSDFYKGTHVCHSIQPQSECDSVCNH